MKRIKVWWKLPAVLILLASFFTFLFYEDNKYQTPPPYGRAGMITLNEQDLEGRSRFFERRLAAYRRTGRGQVYLYW